MRAQSAAIMPRTTCSHLPRALKPAAVQSFVGELFRDDLHAKQVRSLADGTIGVLHAASLGVHAIGLGMATALALEVKHATKQFDRMLSNPKMSNATLFAGWVPYVLADRSEIVIALDWTEFDADDHATIAAYLISNHGRATAFMWKTVKKSELKEARNDYEDTLLLELQALIPKTVRVTLLADRGFGDQQLYAFLLRVGWDFVIRFRGIIRVTDGNGATRSAAAWLHPKGRAQKRSGVTVTADEQPVPAFVSVHAAGMKDAWFLASSRDDLTATEIVKLYGRRFTIEESFRDAKDLHFGMGLRATHIHDADRRDRLLFILALAAALLTLLGAAGERCGLDRTFRTNTSTKRVLSLFRQGQFWYGALPNLQPERKRKLLKAFGEVLREHQLLRVVFGVL